MTREQAMALIEPALGSERSSWADLGAGSGAFTEALAHLLHPDARIVAVEREAAALESLRGLAASLPESLARVSVLESDLRCLDSLDGLGRDLDGVLLANVLHFFEDPALLLAAALARLARHGRIVVVEYEGVASNPWVPHPVPTQRLEELAAALGLAAPRVVARRPSRYHRSMYCAVTDGVV